MACWQASASRPPARARPSGPWAGPLRLRLQVSRHPMWASARRWALTLGNPGHGVPAVGPLLSLLLPSEVSSGSPVTVRLSPSWSALGPHLLPAHQAAPPMLFSLWAWAVLALLRECPSRGWPLAHSGSPLAAPQRQGPPCSYPAHIVFSADH